MRRLSFVLILNLIFSQLALSENVFSLNKNINNFSGSEYFSGSAAGRVMMKVNLLGAVEKPGVHNVPVNTNVTTLLSYAGGSTDTAEMSDLTIKRPSSNGYEVLKYDIGDHLSSGDQAIRLKPNDIIYLPEQDKTVSDNFFRNTTIIATVLTSVLTMLLIEERL